MPLTQQIDDSIRYGVDHRRAAGLHVEGAKGGGIREPDHGAGVGHQYHVVLVAAHHGHAFGGQNSDDDIGCPFDADSLAHRIGVRKERGGGGFAQQNHFAGAFDIGFREIFPVSHRPSANAHVIFADAHDLNVRILAAGRNLGERTHFRAHANNAGDFLAQGAIVALGERWRTAEAHRKAAAADVAGHDQNHVLAQLGNLRFDLRLGAIANAHHGDDGAHADNNSQHGQQGTHGVALQRPQGQFQNRKDSHWANWMAWCSCLIFSSSRAASSRSVTGRSETTRPSRMTTCRRQ